MPAIAGGVQCRCSFGEVIADDAGVADLLVADRELVVRQTDGPRLVRQFGVFQGARMERDGAGLLTAREGDAPMQTPERGELRVSDALAQRVRWTAEDRGSLDEIILQQPRLGQGGTNRQLIWTRERTTSEQRQQQLRGLAATPTLEGGGGSRQI